MNNNSTARIGKIQKYSAYAHTACTAALVLLAVCVGALLFALFDLAGSGPGGFAAGALKANGPGKVAVMAWMLICMAIGLALSIAIVRMLRRIFDNLSRGEIFSVANAREIRRIAFVFLLTGGLKFLLPAGMAVLASIGAMDPAGVAIATGLSLPGKLTPFAMAGILYLASWIMLVGLGVSDEAEQLRRDAELVV